MGRQGHTGERRKKNPNGVVIETTLDEWLLEVYGGEGGVSNDPIADRVFELHEPELFDAKSYLCDRDGAYFRDPFITASVDYGIEFGALTPIKGRCGAGSLIAWTKEGTRKERVALVHQTKDTLIPALAGLYHETINRYQLLAEQFSLTVPELDALRYVAFGLTARDVSDKLKVSERAIERRLERARRKLGAVNTPNAVYRAAVFNLI